MQVQQYFLPFHLTFSLKLSHMKDTQKSITHTNRKANTPLHTSTFWAKSDGLKFDLTTTLTSIFWRPTSRTRGITRNGRLMSLVVRYLLSSALLFQTSISSPSIVTLHFTGIITKNIIHLICKLRTNVNWLPWQKTVLWPCSAHPVKRS